MQCAVTAIYRTRDVAHLVRDELERLGLSRHHITVIHRDERGVASAETDTAGGFGRSDGVTPTVGTPGSAYMGVLPGAGMGMSPCGLAAMPVYRDIDLAHVEAFDELHDLHLPEEDTRTYQQAIRNGDYVVSVEADEEVDIARVQEIMRRPEGAYDLGELDTSYLDADYAPRRRPSREGTSEGMLGRRDDTQSSPYSRYYSRDMPLWPRGGV